MRIRRKNIKFDLETLNRFERLFALLYRFTEEEFDGFLKNATDEELFLLLTSDRFFSFAEKRKVIGILNKFYSHE